MSGALYIVATPIGNLEDITLRAIKTLQEVDFILAEDTRVTKKLLDSLYTTYHIPYTKLLSYHQHSTDSKKQEILQVLAQGKNLALVTDAGTPGVSDPGNELIAYCLSLLPDLKIVPIPGPSAITTALSVSGLDVNRFVFLGFLQKKKRTKLFEWLKDGQMAFAYYDSPYRTIKNLEQIEQIFGEQTQVFVARELTKIHETLYRGMIVEVIQKLQKNAIKGEVVVVVNNPTRTDL